MYLLIELSDIRDLAETVLRKQDPDLPLETIQQNELFLEKLSDLLDQCLNLTDPEALGDLILDDEIMEKVSKLIKFIVNCVILREAIRWFKVIDHNGGLAISIKPGGDPCLLHLTSGKLPALAYTLPVSCKTTTPA